ncbi:abasic site processing protein HMCES-like [Ptiloglossa arizonensis]|uniref:abasic site processing protein HMCES-like n=1 Tax=Ptiloglossa arizonensis TaxID=3350558 RepID=UPI003FA13E0F
MCGRAACSLNPDAVCHACDYKDATGKRRTTSWTDSEVEYIPSFNIKPKDVLPCIVAGSHFGKKDDRVLCAMMWSMIPPWHEGDYKKHNMSTHNARLENLKTSTLYGPPLRRGQRCIVVCEGYYEWKAGKTKKDIKQPYYIYAAQEKGVKADDPTTWKDEWSEEYGWNGFKVLKMAGIFNKFKTEEGKTIYSCTIITTDSNNVLSWMHNRVPLFLKTEKDSQIWLNEELSVAQVVDKLNKLTLSDGDLSWHTVSTSVNNIYCKSEVCRKETKAIEEKKSNPSSFMASWLKRGTAESAKRKSTNTDDNHNGENEKSDKTSPKVAKKE